MTETKREYAEIKGTAMWSFISKASPMSGKYEVTLANLSKTEAEKLKGLGFKVKKDSNEPDSENYKGVYATAKSSFMPEVYDASLNRVPSNVLVGNGSTIVASVSPYTWSFGGRSGIGLNLHSIQVLDLVEYKPEKVIPFKKAEGYTVHTDDDEAMDPDTFVIED